MGHSPIKTASATPDLPRVVLGLSPEADVKRSEEFSTAIRKRDGENIIGKNRVLGRAAEAALDCDPDTFWLAPTGSHDAVLEADFAKPVTFDHILVMEWFNDGQRVERFRIGV